MRDPLVHFVLLGIVIFGLHRLWSEDPRVVEITPEALQAAEADFARQAGHPPDDTQREAILQGLVSEEVLYREGRALSLEEGDPVLRRRVIARMRLLLAATAPAEPDDAALSALLSESPERYTVPARRSLTHVFLDDARHPDLEAALRRAEAELLVGADPAGVGDPFLHGRRLVGVDEGALSALLGAGAAAEIMTLPTGEWLPVRSRYGEHLVWITDATPARTASLEEARGALTADWQIRAARDAEQSGLEAIIAEYEVSTP